MSIHTMKRPAALVIAATLAALPACGNDPAPSGSAPIGAEAASASASGKRRAHPAASASAKVDTKGAPVGVPFPAEGIVKVVNPKNEDPYKGEMGTLRGMVRIDGDAPPDTGLKFPKECAEAAATYGKLFRVGLDKALADAMIVVTGYSGFVPARAEAVKNTIHGCAFAKRTMVLTYGQRVEIANTDQVESYMPYLDGAAMKAVRVAIPGGPPERLYPQEPGHYMIRDQLPKEFLVADVFVLKYATHDVTGLDGKYEIKDIPAGKVKVSVYLPILDKSLEQVVDVKAGDNTLDLKLGFDAKKDLERIQKKPEPPKPAPSGSGPPGPKG